MVGQLDGISERVVQRHIAIGQVEVLDADSTPVSRSFQGVEEPGEVDLALTGSGLGDAPTGLSNLDPVGQVDQVTRVVPPGRHVPGVQCESQTRNLGGEVSDLRYRSQDAQSGWLETGTRGAPERLDQLPSPGWRSRGRRGAPGSRHQREAVTDGQGQRAVVAAFGWGQIDELEPQFLGLVAHLRDAQAERPEGRADYAERKPGHEGTLTNPRGEGA